MATAPRAEILAQDDASPDYNALEILGPPVKPARNEVNLGFAGNCNAGARRAQGEFLMFLNQDCIALAPGWAERMVRLFENPKVGLVGPKLLFPDGSIQSCGGWFDVGKGPFHRYLGFANKDHRLVNTTEPVKWLTGAAIMIRRSDFEQLGGFDEEYKRGYFEDVDLSMRVRYDLNKEIWYCAGAEFLHPVGSSGGIPSHIFRANSIRFHKKWNDLIEPDVQGQVVNY